MTKKSILCVGCSHACTAYTEKSWPYWIGQYYNKPIELLASPGHGVQIGVDKLCLKLSESKFDSVIFQVPSNTRLAVGMNSSTLIQTGETTERWETNGNFVGEEFIAGLNALNNVGAMKKWFGNSFEKLFKIYDKWFLRYVADNTYETEVRCFQNIFLVQELCKLHKVPYYIFFWHPQVINDVNRPLLNSWYNTIDWNRIIPSSVRDYSAQTDILDGKHKHSRVRPEWSVDNYHMNDAGSNKIVEEFILPGIQKINDINN